MIETTTQGAVGIITLARADARNALNAEMIHQLSAALKGFEADAAVRAIILTGTDPAFCAGLDFKDFDATYEAIQQNTKDRVSRKGLLGPIETPIIAAVNGPAVTGGLELALDCDWIIASREHATFADTHASVGLMPAGGMTIRLPQLIGINRARQMSFTGRFINATVAYEWGLANEVCEHAQLLPRAIESATAIAESDPATIHELRLMYAQLGLRPDENAFIEESAWSQRWMDNRFCPETLADRRSTIIARGSEQQHSAPS